MRYSKVQHVGVFNLGATSVSLWLWYRHIL